MKNSRGLANGFVAQFALDEKTGLVSQKATNTPASPGAQLFGTTDLPKRNGVERVMTTDSSLGVRVFHFNEEGGAVQDEIVDCPFSILSYSQLQLAVIEGDRIGFGRVGCNVFVVVYGPVVADSRAKEVLFFG